ncbi:hypothetical protein [Deminuibacter soli]|nr:hypothetical protein [Deminuibacter soli]
MHASQQEDTQSFTIDFRGFLLSVMPGGAGNYRITFPDHSVVNLEKKESRFHITDAQLSEYLSYLAAYECKIQEVGGLIEQHNQATHHHTN